MGRTVIGFGRGAKELRIAVQAYQMTATGTSDFWLDLVRRPFC
jgi:hypothetical protein